eukprot:TRINITY_DN10997_c0_g1_i1.p1 TRINITY_DN10997_c0_g1~~TRINITY_DN10997_c0_g1_i1.p1  ORF type:complete len:534 (+),score=107.25 TRINITY_DN10997_c0_g1_i1:130-1731(+)
MPTTIMETGLAFVEDGCQLRPTDGCSAKVVQCVCDSELQKLSLEGGESLVEGFGDWKIIAQVTCPSKPSRNQAPKRFLEMWKTFKASNETLRVTKAELQAHSLGRVPCIGCRRAAESGFAFLASSAHQSFYPLLVHKDGGVSFSSDSPELIYNRLQGYRRFECHTHGSSKRCILHRVNPQQALEKADEEAWRDMWSAIPEEAREVIMDFDQKTVEAAATKYMKKFCSRCKTEVANAWSILKAMEWFDRPDFLEETGYDPIVYEGLSYDPDDHVLQVSCDESYLAELISFSRKDTNDQERHAEDHIKAQTEVVLIVGHLVHERIKELQFRLAQTEQQMQLCYALATSCLSSKLEKAHAEQLAAEAARDLLADETTTSKSKKKKNKKKKKAVCTKHASTTEDKPVCTCDGTNKCEGDASTTAVPETTTPSPTHCPTAANPSTSSSPSLSLDIPSDARRCTDKCCEAAIIGDAFQADLVEQERRLLMSMGWNNDVGAGIGSLDFEVNLSALKVQQMHLRQKIRDDFDRFCAREQAA